MILSDAAELKSNLRMRWREISKYNPSYDEESVKKHVIGIIGTTEGWKEELAKFLSKLNLPLTESGIRLDLRGIDLSGERFTARRFNEFAYMKNADSRSTAIGEMTGINLEYAVLDGAHFEGVDVSNTLFDFASMKNVVFKNAKCEASSFAGADLFKAKFADSDLRRAEFILSDMRESSVVGCILEGCDFTGSRMLRIKMSANVCDASTKFISQKVSMRLTEGGAEVMIRNRRAFLPDDGMPLMSLENEKSVEGFGNTRRFSVLRDEWDKDADEDAWSETKEIYRQIKLMFRTFGFYSEADEYFFLELKAKRKSHSSFIYRSIMKAVEVLTGYGIKIERMVFLALSTVLFFAVVYFSGSSSLVQPDSCITLSSGERAARALYFSIVTFTTVGYGDIHPVGFMRFVANAEAFSGLLVMGLFVVSITRKFIGD